MIRQLWNLTWLRKTLRVSSSHLENGAPTPFPTATHSTTTTGYSWCLLNRGRSGELDRSQHCDRGHPREARRGESACGVG
jgi:hypothetical protein